jgi:hypothetical protein
MESHRVRTDSADEHQAARSLTLRTAVKDAAQGRLTRYEIDDALKQSHCSLARFRELVAEERQRLHAEQERREQEAEQRRRRTANRPLTTEGLTR